STDPARMADVNRAFIACVQAATSFVRLPIPGARWQRGLKRRRLLEHFLRAYLPSRPAAAGDYLPSVLCHTEADGANPVTDTEVRGHYLRAGTRLSVTPHFSHHMSELWPDPERFDPGRFADDRREDKVHRHAWEPFGGGVHKCLGMYFSQAEVKAVLHHVLLR